MTRASQGSAPVFRAMHPKRGGAGGNYPQWMRTLEEKYQKLHRKITENSTLGNARFTHGLGKSVYDTRLSHVLLKYRDIGSAKLNSKPGPPTKKSGNIPNESDTNTGNAEQTSTCKSNTPDLYLEGDVNTKQTQPSNIDLQDTDYSDFERQNVDNTSNVDPTDHVTKYSDDSFEEEEIKNTQTTKEFFESDAVNRTQNEINNLDLNKTDETVRKTKVVLPDDSRHHRRHVKTSVSRTSKLTSRSCPAKIQSKSALNVKSTETTLLSRNISAQKKSKMFTPMSEEAKHAITETIQEMNISMTTKRDTVKGEVHFIPSRTRKCVKNWSAPKPVKPKVLYNARPVINGVTKTMDELNDDGVKYVPSNNGDECSLQSSVGSSVKERLPDIQNEGAVDRNQIRNQSYRLPGIGKYDIPQTDSLFEITPPGFDIRYNDIQPVENRDSETPPPDIRQRAIDKCSEWLNKYSK